MSSLDLAAHEQDATLTALAGALVALLNRARATDDEREQIVDMLVTLGFDDSGEQGSALDAIGRGRRPGCEVHDIVHDGPCGPAF